MANPIQPGGKLGRPTNAELAARRERYEAAGLDEYGIPLEPEASRGKKLRPQHQDEVRAKIQTSNLVTLLQRNAAGELRDSVTGELYELSPGRIKSAEILLAKSLSTLSATEVVSVNQADRMSESEILGKIAELLKADPRLIQMAGFAGGALNGGALAGRVVDAAPCIVCGNDGLPGGCPSCGVVSDGAGGA